MSDDWREGLTYKDWLFDGSPIRTQVRIDRFNRLDWSKAWIDLGPSVAGNLGPYWHVPMDDGETTHRLYPRVLATKWLLLIRQACDEYAATRVRQARSLSDFTDLEIANENDRRIRRWLGDPRVGVGAATS